MTVDRKNSISQRAILLATERSQSIIGEVADGKANFIAYNAYGHQSAQQNVATGMGFNGQLRDMKTGWYLLGNGYRAYNPRLMRFHSPDSWSPFGRGGLNAYTYCVGDPVNQTDPTGHVGGFWGAVKLFVRENVSFGGSADALAQNVAARNAKSIQRQILSLPGGRQPTFTVKAEPFSVGDALNRMGGSRRMPGDAPRISSVTEAEKRYPGYAWGAAVGQSTSRVLPQAPQSSSLSRGNGSAYIRPRQNSFDAPRTLYNGPPPRDPVVVHERLLGGAPHSIPPQAPPPPPPLLNQAALDNWSSSSSSSSSSSASSSPQLRYVSLINRNTSQSQGAYIRKS